MSICMRPLHPARPYQCALQDKARAARELQHVQDAMKEAKRHAQAAEAETDRARGQLAALKRDAVDAELSRDRSLHAQQLASEVRPSIIP